MKKIRPEIPFLLLLTVLWAVFHYRILFLSHAFVFLDDAQIYYPVWKWGGDLLRNGFLPLWNPDAGFGTPYLAEPQNAVLYPPKLLFYNYFGATTAFNCLILGHHLWVLLGTWVFARARGFSRPAAFLGCLIFGFSFNLVTFSWSPTGLFAFSWIPWVFWAADGIWEGRRTSFLWFSITAGMQMASGYPVFAYLTFLSVILEWILKQLTGPGEKNGWADLRAKLVFFFGALGLAGIYNAAWVLPFMEFSRLSNIQQRLKMPEGMDWNALATWLNPFYLGHPLASYAKTPFSMTVYFAGLPAVVLLLWGLTRRKMDKTAVLLFGTLFLLSLGETAKVGGWLKGILPGYQWVVRSGYWIPLVIFALAIVVMKTSEDLLKAQKSREGKWGTWFVLSITTFLAALAWGVPWVLMSFWFSLLLMLLVGMEGRFSLRLRWTFILLAMVFSVGPVIRGIHFSMDRSFYDEEPALLAKLELPGRIYHTPEIVDQYRTTSGNSVADAYGRLKTAVIPNWPLAYGLEEVCYSNSLFLKGFLPWYYAPTQVSKERAHKILDYLNVRYVLGQMPSSLGLAALKDSSFPLWCNEGCMPKWFSVQNALVQPLDGGIDSMALNLSIDLKNVCFIYDPSKEGHYALRTVREVSRNSSCVVLRAEGKGRALLVSSETAYPGWKAKVNGKTPSLEVVNHDFRGLVLGEDEELAMLVYQPASFRLGCFLSFLVMGVWFGFWFQFLFSKG